MTDPKNKENNLKCPKCHKHNCILMARSFEWQDDTHSIGPEKPRRAVCLNCGHIGLANGPKSFSQHLPYHKETLKKVDNEHFFDNEVSFNRGQK